MPHPPRASVPCLERPRGRAVEARDLLRYARDRDGIDLQAAHRAGREHAEESRLPNRIQHRACQSTFTLRAFGVLANDRLEGARLREERVVDRDRIDWSAHDSSEEVR